MTKARTKAQRRAAKKRAAEMAQSSGMPELAPIDKRQPNGQKRQRADSPQDAQRAALNARAARFGEPTTREGRKAVSAPHFGSQVGAVLDHLYDRREVDRIWGVFSDWQRAEWSYRLRYLGTTGQPKGATVQMMRERFEVEGAVSMDVRTPEERDRAAVANWMRWQGYLGHLSSAERQALHLAVTEAMDLWRGDAPTSTGLECAAALKQLADVASPVD